MFRVTLRSCQFGNGELNHVGILRKEFELIKIFVQFIIIGDDLKVKETDASPSRQYRNISRISMHERYDDNSRNFHDDIALIVVATPFVLTEAFRPVKVTNVAPVVNELCRVGKLKNRKRRISYSMQPSIRLLFNISQRAGVVLEKNATILKFSWQSIYL